MCSAKVGAAGVVPSHVDELLEVSPGVSAETWLSCRVGMGCDMIPVAQGSPKFVKGEAESSTEAELGAVDVLLSRADETEGDDELTGW